MRVYLIGGAVLSTFLGGCSPSIDGTTTTQPGEGQGTGGKAEAWGPSDDPSGFTRDLEYRLDALPKRGEAENIPWAGNYWPTYKDNINDRWDGDGTDSPSTKYAKAFGLDAKEVEDAVSSNHGIESLWWAKACTSSSECNSGLGEQCSKRTGATEGRCIPTWFGICHAWAPVAILEKEPGRAVTHNGVDFKVQDIKALLTLVYNSTSTKFISLRCESGADPNARESFDNYGRPTEDACRDTNAGAYHVIMANYLGLMKRSFVEDRTRNFEVWNQPMRGYEITEQTEVDAAEANRLIGVEDGTTSYRFNDEAKKFVYVKMQAHYIGESPAYLDGNLASTIDRYTHTDYYEYVLELDGQGRIIGGEWVGSSKRSHPDFLWLPLGRRGTVAGGLITYANVKALLDASLR